MGSIFASIWQGVLSVGEVLWPLGKNARLTRAVRWTLHLLLVAAVGILLGVVNHRYPQNAWPTPFLQVNVLPLLFLLLYSMGLLMWLLWTLLAFEPAQSIYPEIDRAWHDGVAALARASIRLTERPLFLIVGRPRSSEHYLFSAADIRLTVEPTPPDADAPLRVAADHNAIYVTCSNVSVLGKWAGMLTPEGLEQPGAESAGLDQGEHAEAIDPFATQGHQIVTKSERQELLRNREDVRELSRRLAHLCRLIVRDRLPYCPLNGILLLLPSASTDTDDDAQQTREACKRDLDAIRNVIQMNCPLLAMVCDMELLPGVADYIRQLRHKNPGQLLRRVGQRFPLATTLTVDEALARLHAAVYWLCNGYSRRLIYKYLHVETPANTPADAMMDGNTPLFVFLDEMRDRARRLADILRYIVVRPDEGTWRFRGCYLGATGDRERAFVPGVFELLTSRKPSDPVQDAVTWTAQAHADDRRCHAQAHLGYGLVVGGWIVIAALIAWLILF